ncbi:MAG: PIN domain nuclease [Acidimicrobiales bacterium]|nr:PIN domain nuclease [Acidimicrobiales bacterium]MYD35149.1 PIN domain nuclease [Acidimicrobiales bacterium]MYI09527.1 PIN domain nuclease [Acidimicrobiales bacterium]
MAVTEWLIDTSALLRLEIAVDADEWTRRVQRGLVRIATVTKLEIGYSTRSAGDHRGTLGRPPVSAMPVEYLTVAAEDRAIEVQRGLAQAGHHRAPSIPDLLLAAVAELAGLTVLHVDKDFDLIAEITGQPVERLALESPQ